MKINIIASRNTKEILRDPLNIIFMLGFPLAVLTLFHVIGANVPTDIFKIEVITPGIAMFGYSFIALFSGTVIAKDKTSSFLMRLFTTPLKASDYIAGYVLPLIPMALAQSVVCYAAGIAFGLELNANVLLSIIVLFPAALLFIGVGLLAGSALNDKQIGGVLGALLTNLSAWFSGAWFDLHLVGGLFEKIAYALPFAHAVDAGKAALTGDYSAILPHVGIVSIYAVVVFIAAVFVFKKKM